MTEKRFKIIYGVDENPFEWELLDNEKDALICQSNGRPICDLLNELHEENKQLKEENQALKDFVTINFSDMMGEKMKKECNND